MSLSTIPIGRRQCPHWENARSRARTLRQDKQQAEEDSLAFLILTDDMIKLLIWNQMTPEQSFLTWTVLSNHLLPPLNLLPAPVNICLNISFMLLTTLTSWSCKTELSPNWVYLENIWIINLVWSETFCICSSRQTIRREEAMHCRLSMLTWYDKSSLTE